MISYLWRDVISIFLKTHYLIQRNQFLSQDINSCTKNNYCEKNYYLLIKFTLNSRQCVNPTKNFAWSHGFCGNLVPWFPGNIQPCYRAFWCNGKCPLPNGKLLSPFRWETFLLTPFPLEMRNHSQSVEKPPPLGKWNGSPMAKPQQKDYRFRVIKLK